MLEQRKFEATTKKHSESIQELLLREHDKRELEGRREQEERRALEKEHLSRLEDL
jgi:hypothetical protein